MTVKPSLVLQTELYVGPGSLGDLPVIAGRYGGRVLIVTAPGLLSTLAENVARRLEEGGAAVALLAHVDQEPTLPMVEEAIAAARKHKAEMILGIGGGSCLDTAKAAAGILPTERPVAAFFHGEELTRPGLPWIAVPTTAGSGAEVTPNAVLIEPEARQKQSIRSQHLVARAAVVDPETMLALPPKQTVTSALDALSHAIEAFTSRGANELTDLLALEAARLIWQSLPVAYADGGGIEDRAALARASLLAGIALANARLGAVHALAHPLGARYHLPHGLVCGVLLPQIMRFNLQVSYEKYARLAETWGIAGAGDVYERAAAAIRHLLGLNRRLGVPSSLKALGLAEQDLASVVAQTLPSGSLAANPRQVREEDLFELLRQNL